LTELPIAASELERRTVARVSSRLIPFLMSCYFVAYLDRVNVGFAALTMNQDLHLSASAFGFGAGIFFIAYFFLEVPSNLLLERVGARRWIARIMFTWGLVSGATALVRGETSFYAVRVLLGIAEKSERDVTSLFQIFVAKMLHAGVGGTAVGAGGESLADHLFRRVAEAGLGEAHALGKLAKKPDVGARFPERLNGLAGKLGVVVTVGALNVGVFEEGGCWKDEIGIVRAIREEKVVDNREKIGAREAAANRILVGSNSAGIGVVYEEGVDAGAVFRPGAKFG